MNNQKITEWFGKMESWLDPPGCETDYAKLPSKKDGCCTIGIVHEHRFAFYYWALHYHETKASLRPVLITIDSHNDIGVSDEVNSNDLDNLDLNNRVELGVYAWIRLRSLNDGHILPALYLNFFSDVYVLLNNNSDSQDMFDSKQCFKDRFGYEHKINIYRDYDQLLNDLPSESPIYLDIDLDFFANKNHLDGFQLGSELLKPIGEIENFVSLEGPFFKYIFHRIVGFTIALEPRYCGGLHNALTILDILNREFFNYTLCTHSCKWKL